MEKIWPKLNQAKPNPGETHQYLDPAIGTICGGVFVSEHVFRGQICNLGVESAGERVESPGSKYIGNERFDEGKLNPPLKPIPSRTMVISPLVVSMCFFGGLKGHHLKKSDPAPPWFEPNASDG